MRHDARTVAALVLASATEFGDATYLVDDETGRTLSFTALHESCGAVAALLRHHGVGRRERVAVVMPNGPATVQLLLGTMCAGRCVVPVNLLSPPAQMRHVIEHSGARLVFAAPEWAARLRTTLSACAGAPPIVEIDPGADASAIVPSTILPADAASLDAARADAPVAVEPADLALVMYTSGTTGRSKGVMLTHGNLAASAHAISREHGLRPGDRVAAVLPLYHINAFTVTMLAALAHGGSLALARQFSVRRFWPLVVARECTWINVVPTIVSYLLEAEAPAPESIRRVRFCRSASAALAPQHHRAFETRFGIGILETMGLTETAAPAFSNPLDRAQRRIGSVGRPSGCEARIADAQGGSLPDGETGEILVRGPQVTPGYLNDPEATAAAFHGDWLRTGDLGRRDADGFFYVTGRIKELIIKGGENIAPREIDEVLLRHPAVADAAAVGMPDRHYGQEILACVILRDAHSVRHERERNRLREELRRFCADELGAYKAPKRIEFVDEFPRGPSGKVQRLKLLERTVAILHNR